MEAVKIFYIEQGHVGEWDLIQSFVDFSAYLTSAV